MFNVDFAQFYRLLSEINNVGLTADQITKLAERTKLSEDDVKGVLTRASKRWEELKPMLIKKTPLTEDQISEELVEHGRVAGIVTLDFDEIVGHLNETSLETLIGDFQERLTGNSVGLQDIEYNVLAAENGQLYLKVTGCAEKDEQ